MPTSPMSQIREVMWFVEGLQPKRVMDAGVGCGKYGFLCREFLEVIGLGIPAFSTCSLSTDVAVSDVVVDGIEIFEKYVTPLHCMIYSTLHIGNALDVLRGMPDKSYDMLLAADLLEHFNAEDAKLFIRECVRVSGAVLITTPNGKCEQGAWFGNEYERHLSTWNARELKACGALSVTSPLGSPSCLLALFGSSEDARRVAQRAIWRYRVGRYVPDFLGIRSLLRNLRPMDG